MISRKDKYTKEELEYIGELPKTSDDSTNDWILRTIRGCEVNSLQLFERYRSLKLLTIKVQCPKCGHIWGIKIDDYKEIEDIPDRKFKCIECEI